jgi:hypothetical protein
VGIAGIFVKIFSRIFLNCFVETLEEFFKENWKVSLNKKKVLNQSDEIYKWIRTYSHTKNVINILLATYFTKTFQKSVCKPRAFPHKLTS